eukprot:1177671-Prorocentrum_minimum.AAC.1
MKPRLREGRPRDPLSVSLPNAPPGVGVAERLPPPFGGGPGDIGLPPPPPRRGSSTFGNTHAPHNPMASFERRFGGRPPDR